MLKAYRLFVFLLLAFLVISCSKQCEDCSDEYKLRFNFRDEDKKEIYKNIDNLVVTGPDNNPLTIGWEITETDSVYVISLNNSDQALAASDTITFIYDNKVLDSGAVSYGYQRDNECCNNPRIIDGLNMLHLDVVRLIRKEFDVYSIIIEE